MRNLTETIDRVIVLNERRSVWLDANPENIIIIFYVLIMQISLHWFSFYFPLTIIVFTRNVIFFLEMNRKEYPFAFTGG